MLLEYLTVLHHLGLYGIPGTNVTYSEYHNVLAGPIPGIYLYHDRFATYYYYHYYSFIDCPSRPIGSYPAFDYKYRLVHFWLPGWNFALTRNVLRAQAVHISSFAPLDA